MRTYAIVGVLVGGALALGAARATAQSGPPIMQPKQAAQRAVAATDAHTRQMESPSEAPAKPAASKPAAPAPAGPQQGTRQNAAAPNARTPGKTPATTPARPAPTAKTAAKSGRDTSESVISTSVAQRGGRSEISLSREVFDYEKSGRRDPFLSLIASGELRPMINDLKLVTVVYDPRGRSVAILRDISTKEQYRVKVGQTLGRMRVGSIQPKSVTFTLDEFGFSRQEVLALGDPSKERTQ